MLCRVSCDESDAGHTLLEKENHAPTYPHNLVIRKADRPRENESPCTQRFAEHRHRVEFPNGSVCPASGIEKFKGRTGRQRLYSLHVVEQFNCWLGQTLLGTGEQNQHEAHSERFKLHPRHVVECGAHIDRAVAPADVPISVSRTRMGEV